MLRNHRALLTIPTLIVWAVCSAAGSASAATAAADRPTDYGAVIANLSREIPRDMKQSHTVGLSIALVDGERTVWTQGFGSANRSRGVPVTPDTLFHIGSSAKTMTAAAVMQLVEQGRVDLDAPLSRYVPEFIMRPRFPGSVITVRSALDLHSGIPGDIENGFLTTGSPFPGYPDRMLRVLSREFPQRPVNDVWSYSNSGFVLLQILVENVSGQDFDTYTREHLFVPSGMPSTTFDDASIPEGDSWARPYVAVPDADGSVQPRQRPREYMNGWGAGSVMSSANDMAAYLKMMIARGQTPGGRVLESSSVREMITPQTDSPLDIMPWRQGLGWYVGDRNNAWMGKSAWWNGDTVHYHTFLRWLPRLRLGAFVTVNTAAPRSLRDEVGLRALGLMVTAKSGRTAPTPPLTSPTVKAPARKLRQAAGLFASGNGLDRIRVAGKALEWTVGTQRANAAPTRMVLRADDWYTPRTGSPAARVSIKPVTVAGRRLLLTRDTGQPFNSGSSVGAEKIPPTYRIPRAWKARIGRYRPTTTVPGTYPGLTASAARLSIKDGVLLWSTRAFGAWTSRVLMPRGPRRAFTFGFTALSGERGSGDVLTPAGPTLSVLGLKFRRTGTPRRGAGTVRQLFSQ